MNKAKLITEVYVLSEKMSLKKKTPPRVNNGEESTGMKRNFANYHLLSC